MRRIPRPEPGSRDSPAPRRTRGNLPAELNQFVGRRTELERLHQQLADGRLVTVTGVGGVGKTRLAVRAAEQLQDRFRDGVWLVELSMLQDGGLLEHAVGEALGLADATGRPPRSVLVDHLAERRTLLVLDGFEHLVDACASLTHTLLLQAPGLRVLATGRRPMGVTGERTYPLAPMPAPAPRSSGADAAGEGHAAGDAVALFADRAAAVVPEFTVTPENVRDVAELCHQLDGIPLALELAAGRLRALSVRQVLLRLDDRFRLLTGGSRGALPRHQTLRTAIGWSHELCTPEERLLWARLSVFAGHFDLEAAEYVCSGPDLPADELIDVLAELVAQSVVIRDEGTAAGSAVRYRMLDTVRAYGAGWLDTLGDTARMRRRHRDWYMGLATWCELDWFSPRQEEVKEQIDSELPNLRAALEFSLEGTEDTHLGQYLAGTLWFYWAGCGRLAEGRHWLDRALELPSEHGDSRLKALWVVGYTAVLQGDTAGALAALQECRDGAELTGNRLAAAYAQHRTGCLALVSDDMPRAEELIRGALARYREIGELNSNVLMGQVELAMAVAFQGDLAGAVALCEEVQEVCEDHGERWTLAYARYVLAYAAWARGEPDRARELLAECLAINHLFHDLLGLVLAVELMALITSARGDPAEAAVLQGAAGRIWPSVGLKLFGSRYFYAPHVLCEERARAALGTVEYERLLREGARLDLAATVERVLGVREPSRHRGAVPAARTASAHQPSASPAVNGGEAEG
ncbi:ATP-binding protein [Streptomyces gobiensis]|uniref:ATP-binding protein n=1 Tax=Streptomyces gobiensis TaxID=2875706 RepID=UPI001E59A9D6|nr:AAA family ATPase [Streptomyces gobiensis]UGY90388.1 regulator [Streptomyces gobiensis]